MLDLDQEATLAPEIQPFPGGLDLTVQPRNIFLTGATGFVAAYVLAELLEQTDATIYTLVRTGTQYQGMNRIRRNLSGYLLWRSRYEDRIVPVPGDLKYPLLGLSPAQFEALAQTVDAVYHVGSKLSYIAPYEFLKAADIGGFQKLIGGNVTQL